LTASSPHFVWLEPGRPIGDLAAQVAEAWATSPSVVVNVSTQGLSETEAMNLEAAIEHGIATFLESKLHNLGQFLRLPHEWQVQVLRTAGGTGNESAALLVSALSRRPIPDVSTQWLIAAVDAASDARLRHRIRPDWSQKTIDNQRNWQALGRFQTADEAWEQSRRCQALAIKVADIVSEIENIPADGTRLLTCDDAGLLEEADRIATLRKELMAKRLCNFHPRQLDPSSIRRTLRREVSRVALWCAGTLRLIGGRPHLRLPSYSDDWSVGRWRQKCADHASFLAGKVAENPGGFQISLGDIAESARKSRRSTWYALVLGMAETAARRGLVPVFVTATLPPEWHPNPRLGVRRYNPRLSPKAASDELAQRWRRTRALCRKHEIVLLGIRVVEPHTDGSPHLHLLLWTDANRVGDLERHFRRHFPASGGSAETALKLKVWDPNGTAKPQTYIMKYILQTLGASPISTVSESEHAEGDVDDAGAEHDRLGSWAAHIGLRRLSLVGLTPGTVGRWTAAHRLLKSEEAPTCPRVRALVHAMRRGRWGAALAILGAIGDTPRFVTFAEQHQNRWGETVRRTTGWAHAATGEICLLRRPVKWEIKDAGGDEGDDFDDARAPGVAIVLSSRTPAAMKGTTSTTRGRPGLQLFLVP
jgi:hypothetical protein